MTVLGDGEEHPRGDFDIGVGRSTLSHHMKTLREAGLTRHRLEGTRCFVSLRKDAMRRRGELRGRSPLIDAAHPS